MRFLPTIPALFWTTAVCIAGEFDFLPETVATVNGRAITRAAVVARLRKEAQRFPLPEDRASLTAAAKSAAEVEIYFFLLRELLAREGIAPSEKAAAAKLAEFAQAVPGGLPEPLQRELRKLASSEHFLWNVALQEYFAKVSPEVVAVSPLEIEQRYRVEQEQFRLPEQCQFGVIRIPKSRPKARELAETARARLLQGEDFDRVASETAPGAEPLSDAEIRAMLEAGDPALGLHAVSRILEREDAFFLIKLKSRTPGRFIPLEQVTPYLRLQLASEKSARALEQLLRRELSKAEIRFFIE